MIIRNYISVALHNLWKNRFFTAVNIVGLSVAFFIAFNVLAYLLYQFSFDKHHTKRDRVFLVQSYLKEFETLKHGTAYPVAQALKDDFPEIEQVTRYNYIWSVKIEFNNEYVRASNFFAADDNIFEVFTLPLVNQKNPNGLLKDKNSLVISEKIAKILFGDNNPVGKSVKTQIKGTNFVFTITGVLKNTPANSTFRPNYLANIDVSFDALNKYSPEENKTDMKESWNRRNWYTFILLSERSSPNNIQEKLPNFIERHGGKNVKTDIRLHSYASLHNDYYISYETLYVLLVLGFLVVFVASANYIILSSALSIKRSKEIGLRKVLGATPSDIRVQFLGESIFLALLALPISILLFKLLVPTIMPILKMPIRFVNNQFYSYIPVFIGLSIIIGLVSGIYVSYNLANINVVNVLKTRFTKLSSRSIFRKSLIIFQLIIVILLLITIFTIQLQYNYGQKKDLGFNRDDIMLISFDYNFDKTDVYLQKIKTNPNVIATACAMEGPPTNSSMSVMIPHFDNPDKKIRLEGMDVGYGFMEVFNFKLIKGRYFSKDYTTDANATILNETAVKMLGIEDPIGKKIMGKKIIGIVRDFHFHSLHYPIPALNIGITHRYISQIAVKIEHNKIIETTGFLKKEWQGLGTEIPFQIESFEDTLSNLYYDEKLYSKIISAVTLIIVLIALSGLFGLTLFMTRTKQRETGIRKVFGAPISSIKINLVKEFSLQVLWAYLVALPISWLLMKDYLQQYAYHTPLAIWVFVVPGLITLAVVLLTVLYHINKAAKSNVIDVLKEE